MSMGLGRDDGELVPGLGRDELSFYTQITLRMSRTKRPLNHLTTKGEMSNDSLRRDEGKMSNEPSNSRR